MNMGTKPSESKGCEPCEVSMPSYPSIHLSKKMPKGIMDKDVGSMVTIIAKCKITQKGVETYTGKEESSMRLDIHDMEIKGKESNIAKMLAKR